MNLENAKELIKNLQDKDRVNFIHDCKEAERYYIGMNDIKFPKKVPKPWVKKSGLREANNRVANSYYNFLVIQKASYLGDVDFDLGNDTNNDRLHDCLGGHWERTVKNLIVNAANCGVAWIHSWIDEDNEFHYGLVDSKQIRAVWGDTLNNKLLLLIREYSRIDTDGKSYDVYEIWDDTYCYAYERKRDMPVEALEEYKCFENVNPFRPNLNDEFTNQYEHGFSEIPFSCFYNNSFHLNDLKPIKGYLDTFDKAFSLFLENLEDTQQVIFVLENLGGTNTREFLERLKQEKAVKLINNDSLKTDLRTITVEIPTEASTTLMDLARKYIFEQGQGVDPSPENYAGNTSGEALKYMYANLEMKAMATEDEFRIGFDHFIKRVCEYLNISEYDLTQIWKRTKINNEKEMIDMVVASNGIISHRTQLLNHPFVDDIEEELKRIKQEEEENNIYFEAFNQQENLNEQQ